MSDEYKGPERRRAEIDPDTAAMIARIDQRTLGMERTIEKLATVERVQAVEVRVDRHISSHVTKGGLFAAWAGTAVAAGLGLVGIFWK